MARSKHRAPSSVEQRDRTNIVSAIVSEPWFITTRALEGVVARVQTEYTLVAELDESTDADLRGVAIRDGVASFRVSGALASPGSWLAWWYNDYETIGNIVSRLAQHQNCHTIVLVLDTPGGMVAGCHELAQAIRETTKVKRVVAYVEGDACSAGYWIASACSEIVASPTAILGCLGVQTSYSDISALLERIGIKEITVTSTATPNKNKAPTDDDGHAQWQKTIDDLAEVFLRDVAVNRNVTPEHVNAHFGRGDVLVGQHALAAKMCDRILTFEELHRELVANRATNAASAAPHNGGNLKRTARKLATRKRRAATAAAFERDAEVRAIVTRSVGVEEGDVGTVVEVRDGTFYGVRFGDDADSEYRYLAEDELEVVSDASTSDGESDSTAEEDDEEEEQSSESDDEDDDEDASEDEDDEEKTARRRVHSVQQRRVSRAVKAERMRIMGILTLRTRASIESLLKFMKDPACTPERAAHRLLTGSDRGATSSMLGKLAHDEAVVRAAGGLAGDSSNSASPQGDTVSAVLAAVRKHKPGALAGSKRSA